MRRLADQEAISMMMKLMLSSCMETTSILRKGSSGTPVCSMKQRDDIPIADSLSVIAKDKIGFARTFPKDKLEIGKLYSSSYLSKST